MRQPLARLIPSIPLTFTQLQLMPGAVRLEDRRRQASDPESW